MSEFDVGTHTILTGGHKPVVAPVVKRGAPRCAPALIERFRSAYMPEVSDAVGPLYTMDSGIKPLYTPMPRLVGQALTVKAVPGDNLTVHGALSMVQPGDIIVIDWRGYVDGCATGAGSIAAVLEQGLVGAVVDGAWRDIGELRSYAFPVWGRAVCPSGPPKLRPGEINVPICCGGVIVHPGDIIVGDHEEGMVVVPLASAERVGGSLLDYEPRNSVEEWNPEVFEERRQRRREYFERIFGEYGGVMPE